MTSEEARFVAKNRQAIEGEEHDPANRIAPTIGRCWRHVLIRSIAQRLAEVAREMKAEAAACRRGRRDIWIPRSDYLTTKVTGAGGVIDLGPKYVALVITPASRERALSIADAFFSAMEARGFSTQLCENVTLLSCADVRMKFRLSEVVHRPKRSEPIATGMLRITLSKHDYAPGTLSNLTVVDSDGKLIEAQLNGLAVRLRSALMGYEDRQRAVLIRSHAAKALAVERECASWHEWAAKEAAEGERAKLQALLLESDRSDTCERIRRYLDRVKAFASAQGIDVSERSALGRWISHEKLSCDLADPLTSRIAEFTAPPAFDTMG
ncbi:hypothetical protein [Burkholderia glumae]|uniref:hypothetical protein n=1 Tax=Burkholderia glumae TaxID=337 RepID=UPI0012FD2A4A|nr:hypothetical protein [Burkholderia glumae]QHE09819.1 hypothetical protein GQR88_05075 [Burkholderia glumae AU6208]